MFSAATWGENHSAASSFFRRRGSVNVKLVRLVRQNRACKQDCIHPNTMLCIDLMSNSSAFASNASYSKSRIRKQPISFGGLVKAFLILFCAIVTSPIWWSGLTFLFSCIIPTPEVTPDHLLEQAKGEAFYWTDRGESWSLNEACFTRHPKRRARRAAILKLSSYQPLPEAVRQELISMLVHGESDFDSGDGVYSFRSAICYTLGRSANHPAAYDAIIDVFRQRATSPEMDQNYDVKWFDKKWCHYDSWHTGPASMMNALRFTPSPQHDGLKKKLVYLKVELERAPQCSKWALRELTDTIAFFDTDPDHRDAQIEMEVESTFNRGWK